MNACAEWTRKLSQYHQKYTKLTHTSIKTYLKKIQYHDWIEVIHDAKKLWDSTHNHLPLLKRIFTDWISIKHNNDFYNYHSKSFSNILKVICTDKKIMRDEELNNRTELNAGEWKNWMGACVLRLIWLNRMTSALCIPNFPLRLVLFIRRQWCSTVR